MYLVCNAHVSLLNKEMWFDNARGGKFFSKFFSVFNNMNLNSAIFIGEIFNNIFPKQKETVYFLTSCVVLTVFEYDNLSVFYVFWKCEWTYVTEKMKIS